MVETLVPEIEVVQLWSFNWEKELRILAIAVAQTTTTTAALLNIVDEVLYGETWDRIET